ncbi:MAG: ComEC/Rec2 family competence protein [Planctomycetaceae bacterium]
MPAIPGDSLLPRSKKDQRSRGEFQRRLPAVTVAVAAAVGIGIDRWLSWPVPFWLLLGGVAWFAWVLCQVFVGRFFEAVCRHSATAWLDVGCVLSAVACLFGGWHHLCWSTVGPNEVARYARDELRPVKLRARIAERPVGIPAHDYLIPTDREPPQRHVCLVDCLSLESVEGSIPVTGRARLDVTGDLVALGAGDVVEIVGAFGRPRGPANPGGFDYRAFLRSLGVHVTIHCTSGEEVRLIAPGRAFGRRWQGALRTSAEKLLSRHLSKKTAPVGIAMLLGTRTAIPEELRNAFTESGTMHILAISGANVGILAGLLWGVARLLRLQRRGTALFILVGVCAYSFLAESQPPVLRAVLMVLAVVSGQAWHRCGPLANGLSLAVIGLLIWNPTHLFDTGAQLSFLAVAALLWAPTLRTEWTREGPSLDPLDQLERSVSLAARLRGWFGDQFRYAALLLVAVWIFTLPLTVARFHLVSPIGFLANLLLGPLSVAVLWAGYLLLTLGLAFPMAGVILGPMFDWGLKLMILVVEQAARVPGGHLYLPGPGIGWVVGFYLLLIPVLFGIPGRFWRRLGWRAILVWCVLGLGYALWPRGPEELRCTFLSVGHGLGVLVEFPGGRSLVYDLGQMHNGQGARLTLQNALWERGRARVDALVISHADGDHFNGIPGLARRIGVGQVIVHSSYLDEPAMRSTVDDLARDQVPLRIAWQGDQLELDQDVTVRVLHPARGTRYSSDNASSLVLLIEYRGQRILLTGDIEEQGLLSLLRQEPVGCRVLLAPHHGSRLANPIQLANWARPQVVVVSGGHRDGRGGLNRVYGSECQVLSTHDHGAITCVIGRDGRLRVEGFRTGPLGQFEP